MLQLGLGTVAAASVVFVLALIVLFRVYGR
jgi:hypothetical protein